MKEFPSGFGIVIQLNLDVFSTPVILNITRMQFGLGFFRDITISCHQSIEHISLLTCITIGFTSKDHLWASIIRVHQLIPVSFAPK